MGCLGKAIYTVGKFYLGGHWVVRRGFNTVDIESEVFMGGGEGGGESRWGIVVRVCVYGGGGGAGVAMGGIGDVWWGVGCEGEVW